VKKTTRKKRERRNTIAGVGIVIIALIGISFLIITISPKQQINQEEQPVNESELELPIATETPTNENKIKNEPQMLASITPYYEQNNDTVGYIRIDNTVIDYPVLFSGDNEFYMTRDFTKQDKEGGAIFMDFRVDYSDIHNNRNVILYGHRMRDGTMFKDLTEYEKKDFFYNNSRITFDTLYEHHEWEVFAAFQTHIDFYYIQTHFENDQEWLNFLYKCQDLSKFETDTKFYATDTILTLSTCTGSNRNKRWVVMARLIE